MKRDLGIVLALTVALCGAAGGGCTTSAYCFADCEPDGGGGAAGAAGAAGEAGSGGPISTDVQTECVFNCGDATSDVTGDCTPTNGGIEICDGVDNDCNGAVDDGIDFTKPTTCGSCDNNCLKKVKNAQGITCNKTTCGYTKCDDDFFDVNGDKSDGCEYFCDFAAKNNHQPAKDDSTCDALDNDCDGLVDEDVDVCADVKNCGACGKVCSTPHATPECVHTPPNKCDTTNTECKIKKCDDGWVDLNKSANDGCEYECTATGPEVCNGKDDDCDGLIDNADPDLTKNPSSDPKVGVACQGGTKGVCADPANAGVTVCKGAIVVCEGPKVVFPGAQQETCNGLDDDCNGLDDDNPKGENDSCGKSTGNCTPGLNKCQLVGGKKQLVCVGEVGPKPEVCNGQDDDCNGTIDDNATDVGGPCGSSVGECKLGAYACVAATKVCQNATGPKPETCNGKDDDCNNVIDDGVNVQTDVKNCGACGNDCTLQGVHANWTCQNGQCVQGGCKIGFVDCNGDKKECEVACSPQGKEVCNGVDDDCNCLVDDALQVPSPASVCGVSPGASDPNCTTNVTVGCQAGQWKCTFPPGYCNGGNPPKCSTTTDACDGKDNNCNGGIDENYKPPILQGTGVGAACSTGIGACKASGVYACNPADSTKTVCCTALGNGVCAQTLQPKDCATLPGGCAEACDGIDNDCDGKVDEVSAALSGADASIKNGADAYYVKPAVVKLGAANLWVHAYEASRPNAGTQSAGSGYGYWTAAPPGATLDKTVACSVPSRVPWFNVTGAEGRQACTAIGGRLCRNDEWQTACKSSSGTCTWGYGNTCTTSHYPAPPATCNANGCNLGCYDFDGTKAGIQNGLLPTSFLAAACYADWGGAGKLFDVTGNLREATYCMARGAPCASSPECCSGLVCTSGRCIQSGGAACVAKGMACTGSPVCCDSLSCSNVAGYGNHCGGCRTVGLACTNNGQCCNGQCLGGYCGGVPGTAGEVFPLMGGAFSTQSEAGAACSFTFYTVDQTFQLFDMGFRCCFDQSPL